MDIKMKAIRDNNDDPTNKLNRKEQWRIPFKIIAFI